MGKTELASYIQSLGLSSKLQTFRVDFEKRLEFQKTIYLLQESGADLGYQFGWYKHGPYSSSLADDVYSLGTIPPEVLASFQVDVNHDAIKKFKELTSEEPNANAHYLELISSVDYVTSHSYPRARTKKEAVDSIFTLKGDRFTRSAIENAYELLKRKGFIREKE